MQAGIQAGIQADSPTVSWMPLALTLGLHLLLVPAWLLRPGMPSAPPAATERAAVLVMLAPPVRPVSHPVERRAVARTTPRPPAPRALARDAADDAPAAAAGVPAASELLQDQPAPAASGDLLASSRAMAGRIDRELLKGGSPITAEPERKWEGFAATVAAARNSGSMAGTLDRHTADDGVTIYRKTVGPVVRCYRSGSVGGISPADGHTAGSIPCPTGVRWTRL